MTEVNALLGLEILKEIDEMVKNRNKYAELYRTNLSKIPGLKFQTTTLGAVHTYKDFAIIVDPKKFGIDRDKLYDALSKENIMTRKYFNPAVHQLKAYSRIKHDGLPNTEFLTRSVLCLPIYSFMEESLIKDICQAIERVQHSAGEISEK
ncbi:MAG: DegT/DnrJ/EryC1/StrS family aminotransferase [Dehalococcoidia bacterium]|nr:DegT/DnrJ/EryC1/StrS family aminotransferase [Dehalococcoidia bacterium]